MLFKTPKWIITVLAIAVLGILLIPGMFNNEPAPSAQKRSPRFEMAQKRSLVDKDIMLTDRLCRLQCSSELRQVARELQASHAKTAEEKLSAVRTAHPHMISLTWKRNGGDEVSSGGLPASARLRLEQYLVKAKAAVEKGEKYESPRIKANGEYFLVLGAPDTKGGGVTGVVRQEILNAVDNHQRKNLRLVPYPPEGNYKIESVDSDTHRDIHVDSGEENAGASHYHKHQVVVKFKGTLDETEANKIKSDLNVKWMKKLGYTWVIESKDTTAEEMQSYFRKARNVEYAEPHYLYMTNDATNGMSNGDVPNDYLFEPYQWNLPITRTIPGWSITKGSDAILVGVLDTGVDLKHPDLAGRIAEGMNIVNPEGAPMDDVGHGTHVAGVISASVNNTEGVAGMTWYDKVLPVKVLDESGAGSTYSVAEGLIWATDHGAKVINMSLGNYAQAEFLHDAVRYAFDHDVVLIAATGNDNTEDPGYPAAYPEVFAVSATDENRQRAPFSNFGDYVDVVAPGVSIASTYPHNQYAALSGTSMASPHVSALAALIRSVNPLLRNTEVMDIMRKTAIDLGPKGRDPDFGYGQIDVSAALQEAERMKQSVRLFPEWVRRDIEKIRMKYEG